MRDLRVRRGTVGALALAVLLGGGLSACGSDEDPFANEELEEPIHGGLNNEDVLADPAIVADGLGVIKGFVNDVMNKVGSEEAELDNEAILPVWEDVEGRVKAEDPAAHTLLEAQFLALTTAVENKDKDAGRAAGNAIIQAIDAYLAKPRTASPSPSTSITPSPSSTAIPMVTPTYGATPSSTATSSATASPTVMP